MCLFLGGLGPVPEFATLTLGLDAGLGRALASLLIRVLLQPASAPLRTHLPANPSTSFLLIPANLESRPRPHPFVLPTPAALFPR